MHPYVKLRKLLRLSAFLIILSLMLSSAASQNSGVRNIQLYSEIAKGYVQIEGKKVVASSTTSDPFLQTITVEKHYFVIYDPRSKAFICWNKSFTNLVAKRCPRDLRYCKFEERVSLVQKFAMTRYVTRTRGEKREFGVEMRFNKNGKFATQKFINRCLNNRRRKYPFLGTMGIMKLNPLNINSSAELEAYSLAQYCADADFLPISFKDDSGTSEFCANMRQIDKRHKIAKELRNFCQHEWNKT